jgi:hypothetical protein
MSRKRLSNLLVKKYVKPRMKAEQFLQEGRGGRRDSGILILEASASLLLQCYFQKLTGNGRTRRRWVLVSGLQTLVCLGFFRGNRAPLD